ncbi:MAG TPA: xanthine dehydrogenase family protein molybdopterin-binding subunit [Thermomicrobiales bacterium]|nr:xanthine dehydrogenase family protein molybdopterin-binding subunit [Thermomicrobiales bacterium]
MTSFEVKTTEQDGQTQLEIREQAPGVTTWDESTSFSVVGKGVSRLEAFEKVTGRAQYSSDVRLPRQAYAKVLRSPHPHARIRRIDLSAAEAMPGVVAAICKDNIDRIEWYDGSAVFDDPVRLVGDEVAAVAAVSEEIAEDALRAIRVDYEVLPHVTALQRATEPDAPRARLDSESEGNVSGEVKTYERGDPDGGLRQADVVIDEIYTTQAAVHNALEPHGCTASWDGDELTLWDSTQSVFTVRQQVALALGMPEHKVRVIKQHMGGGFGAKQIAWKQDVIAALLSKKAGRPVQLMLDREAENLAVGNRPNSRQRVRLGATRDGTLTAIVADIEQANGAYQTGGEASNVSGTYQTLYKCENVRTVQTPLYTNTGPAVAFRAPGQVEGAWALEQAMDELSLRLRIDPIELRLKNYAETDQSDGDKPLSLPEGLALAYKKVVKAVGWNGRPENPESGRIRKGVGFAAHDWGAGGGSPPGYAWIELNSDGAADVVTGTQDIGTGTRTGLAQVAAEALGLTLEDIAFHLGDTSLGPYSPVSSGSATQATIGPAIQAAAADIQDQLKTVAANAMEISKDRLSVRDGHVLVDGDASRGMSVKQVMQEIAPNTLRAQGARIPNPDDRAIRTFGAQVAEVEVDTETGEVTVTRVYASHEFGRVINPTMVESQVIGAITQGLGFALTEERVIDHDLGIVLNPNLEEYKVPTVLDIPEMIQDPVDVPDLVANPTGAKGIGEPPLVPTAPAIANAITNAIGVRFHDAPVTRERVLEALANRRSLETNANPTTDQEQPA